MEVQAAPAQAPRSELLELSNEMVRLYKEMFGRGPTKSRSVYAGRNAVLCTLENSFTPAEHSLVEMGEHERLRDTRMMFQYAARPQFVAIVERVTGRKVRAFVSGVDTETDVASELFYLEPEAGPEPEPEPDSPRR
jgi:uncharacterized protein YbcI